MSKTINNSRGADTLAKGLSSLKFFATDQVSVSVLMVVMSFIMMLSAGIALIIGVVVLIISLGIILHLSHLFEHLSETIDSFQKYSENVGKNSEKMMRLSYTFLKQILKNKWFNILSVLFFLDQFPY